jgi:hypothetical protein
MVIHMALKKKKTARLEMDFDLVLENDRRSLLIHVQIDNGREIAGEMVMECRFVTLLVYRAPALKGS